MKSGNGNERRNDRGELFIYVSGKVERRIEGSGKRSCVSYTRGIDGAVR